MSIYKSNLRFQLADYTWSHDKVLFRNSASGGSPINTDIIFTCVDSLDIKTDYYGIEIDIMTYPVEKGGDSVFSLKCLKTGVISSITALAVNIFENDLSTCESSLEFSFRPPFDNYWLESKNFKTIYPCPEGQSVTEKSFDASEAEKLVLEIGIQTKDHDDKLSWEAVKVKTMQAVQTRDWETIRQMVLSNPKLIHMRYFPEWKTPFNEILIHGADIDTVRFLLENGADVNRRDFWGETAIFNAVRSGVGLDMIRLLFEHGTGIDITALKRLHILHVAARHSDEETLAYLLSLGADPGSENFYHERPIDWANTERKKEILREAMIARGIDPERKNGDIQ